MKFLTCCLLACVLIVSVLGRRLPLRLHSPNHAEEGSHFEGDIILNSEQWNIIRGQRTGLLDNKYRWTNREVPYIISSKDFNAEQAAAIRQALDAIESVTCLRFVVRTTQTDYVSVTVCRRE